jgi:hypothetical protein
MLARLLRLLLGFFEKTVARQEAVPEREETYDLFMPEDRLIFNYWDGKEVVRVDPIVLYKKMQEKGPEMSIDIKVAHSMSKDANTAHSSLVKKIRDIFGVKAYEEGGLTELETTQLLDHFLLFCHLLKKNSSPSPTSPTETSSPSEPSSEGPPPTPNGPGTGSTENEYSTDGQPPSPTGPA